jgi:hypothetical protein
MASLIIAFFSIAAFAEMRVELRTRNSNQRHGEIVCAPTIAHNVNSTHQAAGVGLKCADPRGRGRQ